MAQWFGNWGRPELAAAQARLCAGRANRVTGTSRTKHQARILCRVMHGAQSEGIWARRAAGPPASGVPASGSPSSRPACIRPSAQGIRRGARPAPRHAPLSLSAAAAPRRARPAAAVGIGFGVATRGQPAAISRRRKDGGRRRGSAPGHLGIRVRGGGRTASWTAPWPGPGPARAVGGRRAAGSGCPRGGAVPGAGGGGRTPGRGPGSRARTAVRLRGGDGRSSRASPGAAVLRHVSSPVRTAKHRGRSVRVI